MRHHDYYMQMRKQEMVEAMHIVPVTSAHACSAGLSDFTSK